MPPEVPNAIVLTGTFCTRASCAAASAASVGESCPSPRVGAPSLISTIAAGTGLPVVPFGTAAIASSDSRIPAAVAVPAPTDSDRMAAVSCARSVVGATSSRAALSKLTSPTWTPRGRFSTNCAAWASAAASRLGATSVAVIDAEVSRVSMMVALSLGVRIATAGSANARVSTTRESSIAAAGTCRCQPCRRGATESRRSTLVNRTTWVWRRRWTSR